MLVTKIGNTYSASTLLGLAAVLDQARPGERILAVSYGSGAGSDAISLLVRDTIEEKRNSSKVLDYVNKKIIIDYSTYAKFRRLLVK